MSYFLQYDADVTDITTLRETLKNSNLDVLSVTVSRWRDTWGNDKGARLDVEVEDTAGDMKVKLETASVVLEQMVSAEVVK